MRTYSPKPGDVDRKWYVIDATDVVLGRLASQVAILLRGKHKPTFAPHMDMGDYVIVINADKVALTGSKLRDKMAYHHSGYPGGLADAFTIAFDVLDSGWNPIGFLPNAGPEPGPMALVVKNGTEPPAEPTIEIAIDGDFSDWALVPGVSNGNYGMFKAYSDADYIYLYSWRTTEGRYSDIWGGSGYVYFALNLDGDESTGVELWGNGPYEFVGVTYPYAGSADAPEINEKPGDACMPEDYTLENVECKGVVNENGAYVEFRIPRADLPAIPNTPITVYSWGNKDLTKVALNCTL